MAGANDDDDNPDIVKDQFDFARLIPGFGFFGSLTTFSPTASYRVRLASPSELVLSGTPFDPTGTVVDLLAGWTWFGFPSMSQLPMEAFTDALTDTSTLTSTDQIKGQFAFATWIAGFGWYGVMTSFEPGAGYMVKLAAPNTLTSFGASSAAAAATTLGRQRNLEAAPLTEWPADVVNFGDWKLKPAVFDFSMCIVAVVIVDDTVAQDGDLAAFVGGELRGIAHPSSYLAPVGPYKGYRTYNLMAYGQTQTERLMVSFQYRYGDGRILKLGTNIPYAKDALVGSVGDPFLISASLAWWHARE